MKWRTFLPLLIALMVSACDADAPLTSAADSVSAAQQAGQGLGVPGEE